MSACVDYFHFCLEKCVDYFQVKSEKSEENEEKNKHCEHFYKKGGLICGQGTLRGMGNA